MEVGGRGGKSEVHACKFTFFTEKSLDELGMRNSSELRHTLIKV